MGKTTKYSDLTNFFLDNWIFASIILIAVIIAFIPSLRDGVLHILNFFRLVFKKKNKDFIIEHEGEKITFEYKTKSTLFDIVKINATTHHLGVGAEYKWLQKYYPDYDRISQSLSLIEVDENRSLHFDTILLKNDEGVEKNIYFDISEFFNDGGHTSSNLDEFARKKVKELYNKK